MDCKHLFFDLFLLHWLQILVRGSHPDRQDSSAFLGLPCRDINSGREQAAVTANITNLLHFPSLSSYCRYRCVFYNTCKEFILGESWSESGRSEEVPNLVDEWNSLDKIFNSQLLQTCSQPSQPPYTLLLILNIFLLNPCEVSSAWGGWSVHGALLSSMGKALCVIQLTGSNSKCSLQILSYPSVLHTHVKMVSHLNFSLFCHSCPWHWREWGLWDRGNFTVAAKFSLGRKIQSRLGIQLWGDDHSCAAAAAAELNKSLQRRLMFPLTLLGSLGGSWHESSPASPFPAPGFPCTGAGHPRLHLLGSRAHSSSFSPANVAGNL